MKESFLISGDIQLCIPLIEGYGEEKTVNDHDLLRSIRNYRSLRKVQTHDSLTIT